MIKLPVSNEQEEKAQEEEQFEYNRFGVKIMIYPREEQWVKDCLTGQPIRKEDAIVFRRDANDNFYYVRRNNTEPIDEGMVDLIPSRWDEDFK